MKSLLRRHKVIVCIILACIGYSVVLFSLFEKYLSKNSYLVLNQRADISTRCEDDNFIQSLDREQNNENKETLIECKNTKKKFEHSLRKNVQLVNKYSFSASKELIKRLQLDSNGIEFLAT